jgi:MFS family permease
VLWAAGVIEGIADGLAGLARLLGGALADDPDRRRAVAVGGYTSTAVLSSAIGLAQSIWQVAFLRAGAWAARGLRVPSRNALLADAVPLDAYGRAYGFERAMDNLGAIGGPVLALALVALFSVRTAIVVSMIPGCSPPSPSSTRSDTSRCWKSGSTIQSDFGSDPSCMAGLPGS